MDKLQEQTRLSCQGEATSAMQGQIMYRYRMDHKSLLSSHADSLWVTSVKTDTSCKDHEQSVILLEGLCRSPSESAKPSIKWALVLGQQRNKKGRCSMTCAVNFKVFSACSQALIPACVGSTLYKVINLCMVLEYLHKEMNAVNLLTSSMQNYRNSEAFCTAVMIMKLVGSLCY